MSKKKAKKAAKPAPKKKAAKKAAKKATSRALAAAAPPGPRGRTSTATIFIYEAGGQTRVRTAPAVLTGGPGHLEWTVVNLTGNDVPVEITWGPDGGPWGRDPIRIDGSKRIPLHGAREGHFKYTVTAGLASEDPEIEIPQN
jgi:hypothetical protein